MNDAQTAARQMVERVTHPRLGEIPVIGTPVKYSRMRPGVRRPAPMQGEHTDEVLTECGLLRRGHPGAPREEGRPVGREGLRDTEDSRCCSRPAASRRRRPSPSSTSGPTTAGVVYYTSDLASIPPAFRDSATPISTPQARPAQPAKSEPAALRVTPERPSPPRPASTAVPLTLIVDTGADRTVIAPDVLERAGLGGQGGRPVQVVGITGVSTATLVTVPMLDVAGARIGPLAVIALSAPADVARDCASRARARSRRGASTGSSVATCSTHSR
jgi:hypothetical protein